MLEWDCYFAGLAVILWSNLGHVDSPLQRLDAIGVDTQYRRRVSPCRSVATCASERLESDQSGVRHRRHRARQDEVL